MEKHLERHLLRKAFKEFPKKTLGDQVEESLGIAFGDLCPGLGGRVIGERKKRHLSGAPSGGFRERLWIAMKKSHWAVTKALNRGGPQ